MVVRRLLAVQVGRTGCRTVRVRRGEQEDVRGCCSSLPADLYRQVTQGKRRGDVGSTPSASRCRSGVVLLVPCVNRRAGANVDDSRSAPVVLIGTSLYSSTCGGWSRGCGSLFLPPWSRRTRRLNAVWTARAFDRLIWSRLVVCCSGQSNNSPSRSKNGAVSTAGPRRAHCKMRCDLYAATYTVGAMWVVNIILLFRR